MKETYYTLENGNLKKVGNVIRTAKGYVSNPTEADYAAMVDANGKPNPAFPRSEESFAPPKCDEGYHAVPDGYELQDGKWVKLWKVEPIVYTADDYDNAMEDYIREVRVARGYTTREPDDYFGSSNPRWSQDAKDWVAFRDAVMTYALDVINTYTKTGNAPTLAKFKAGFPKMVWTYQEEV
jgi:hypothetical protein